MEKHPGLDAEEEVASYRHRKQVQLGHLPTVSLGQVAQSLSHWLSLWKTGIITPHPLQVWMPKGACCLEPLTCYCCCSFHG